MIVFSVDFGLSGLSLMIRPLNWLREWRRQLEVGQL